MSVYKAINAVQADLSREGISKDRNNQQQGYRFRGIDDVYNALSPLLAKHGLCVLPRCTSREVVERVNAKGTALFYVTVRAEFDFISAADGSKHTVVTYGEAMDSGDKATNKAMSAAYKYACMQAFSIPTEGENDPDSQTHEVKPTQRNAHQNVGIDPARGESATAVARVSKQGESEVVEQPDLPAGMANILNGRLATKSLTRADLLAGFGPVSASNINQALQWIKEQK